MPRAAKPGRDASTLRRVEATRLSADPHLDRKLAVRHINVPGSLWLQSRVPTQQHSTLKERRCGLVCWLMGRYAQLVIGPAGSGKVISACSAGLAR